MQFQHFLYAKPLLAKKQRESLYKITKKIRYLSLAALLTNSVSAIEADGKKNTPSLRCTFVTRHDCPVEPTTEMNYAGYSQFATAPTPWTFDYDPSLLPEVAEAIFALRIKHANIGGPFVINLSGNYLLKFTKRRIYILDTYTKKNDIYEYQSTNPNITIGLGVSKGLPRNYKSITIKEDAQGLLYNYAALHSDNISTNETILSETLSHPFYEIAGKKGADDEVTVSKAMAFYRREPSHQRHARCVKPNRAITDGFMGILTSGIAVCGPKAAPDIRSANHKSIKEFKLDQPLVEAAAVDKGKFRETVGFHLEVSLDFGDENALAFLTSAYFCNESIMGELKRYRQKRSPNSGDCPNWVSNMVNLYRSLGLDFNNVNRVVQSVKYFHYIPAICFPDSTYPEGTEASRKVLAEYIASHIKDAARVLQEAAAIMGEAAAASSFLVDEQSASTSQAESQAESRAGYQVDIKTIIAEGKLAIYSLNKEEFNPLPNVVKVLKTAGDYLEEKVIKGQYTTYITCAGHQEKNVTQSIESFYTPILSQWIEQIGGMIESAKDMDLKAQLMESHNIASAIYGEIKEWKNNPNLVIGAIYHNGILIGISVGQLDGKIFRPMFEISSPESLLLKKRSYRGQLAYLRSEVLKYLFSEGLIDIAKLLIITKYSAGKPLKPYYKHDEL